MQDTTIALGSSVHDKANVAGVTGIPVSGNVTFTFYPNATCTGTGTGAGTVTVTSGVAHPSTSQGPLGAGDYSFKARYNGDANYNADDAPCEKVTVAKARLDRDDRDPQGHRTTRPTCRTPRSRSARACMTRPTWRASRASR